MKLIVHSAKEIAFVLAQAMGIKLTWKIENDRFMETNILNEDMTLGQALMNIAAHCNGFLEWTGEGYIIRHYSEPRCKDGYECEGSCEPMTAENQIPGNPFPKDAQFMWKEGQTLDQAAEEWWEKKQENSFQELD
jgi:hypothetical protein